jgi:hypothetical protein
MRSTEAHGSPPNSIASATDARRPTFGLFKFLSDARDLPGAQEKIFHYIIQVQLQGEPSPAGHSPQSNYELDFASLTLWTRLRVVLAWV